METRELQETLKRLGFYTGQVDGELGPETRLATARFQLACALPGHRLVVDGTPGVRTWAALREVDKSRRLSPNFTVAELRSKGDGTVWVHRDLLDALERLRSRVGKPLTLVSGWRDVAHNRRVGGATRSQHTFGAAPELERIKGRFPPKSFLGAGRAVDFNRGYVKLDDLAAMNIFSGIGYRDGWVTHADVRTSSLATKPTIWRYG